MPGTMLILRGKTDLKAWPKYPNGALDEQSALQYAKNNGYEGRVLPVSGETGSNSKQTEKALQDFLNDQTITALYGFSGGGYNVRHILDRLKADPATAKQLARLELIVVIGVDKQNLSRDRLLRESYKTSCDKVHWEVVYRNDPKPPLTHIDGPRALLEGRPFND